MPVPDANTRAHLEWLGFIQPNGLLVSAPALIKAGAILNQQDAEGRVRLAGCLEEREIDASRGSELCLRDFRTFATRVLGWRFSPQGYAGTDEVPIPEDLQVPLPDFGETLRPDFAVLERDPSDGGSRWQLLVQVPDDGQDFDKPVTGSGGLEAVVVSVVHVAKGEFVGSRVLDGASVENITAFLFHRGEHDDPVRLAANAGKSFVGSYVLGMGFTFDDTDKKGEASSLVEMQRLIGANPRNGEVIFPYIGGKEVNASPTQAHHRYVINFGDFPLCREDSNVSWTAMDDRQRRDCLRNGRVPFDYPDAVAADWSEILGIVEQRVKPKRMTVNRKIRRERWWQFGDRQPALYAAIVGLEQVLAISRVGQQASLAFLPAGMVYSETTVVFPLITYASFCALQSRPHEIWARFFGSSLEDRLRYTPSDCFETFPFPEGWETRPALTAAGQE